MNKKEKVIIKTHEVSLMWPYIQKPQTEIKNHGKIAPNYNVTIYLEENHEETKELVHNIRETWLPYYDKLCTEKNKKVPYRNFFKTHDDNPKYIEKGIYAFNPKLSASGVDAKGRNWEQRPAIYDSSKREITKALDDRGETIGNGTRARLAIELSPYFISGTAGIALKLRAVQIIDLKVYDPSSSKDLFTEVEGFTVAETVTANATESEYDFD